MTPSAGASACRTRVHPCRRNGVIGCSPAPDSSSTTRGAKSFFRARSDRNAPTSGVRVKSTGPPWYRPSAAGFTAGAASSVMASTGGTTNESTVSDGQLSRVGGSSARSQPKGPSGAAVAAKPTGVSAVR